MRGSTIFALKGIWDCLHTCGQAMVDNVVGCMPNKTEFIIGHEKRII